MNMKVIHKDVVKILELIRSTRISRGYSQEYMAAHLGITQANYGKLERGISELNLKKFLKIVQVFEEDLLTFLTRDTVGNYSKQGRNLPVNEMVPEYSKFTLLEEQIKHLTEINEQLKKQVNDKDEQLLDKEKIIALMKQNDD